MRSARIVAVWASVVVSGAAFGKPAAKVAAKPPAAPQQSFADALDEATPAPDLAKLIDPLFDNCSTDDALDHRQCEAAREFLETQTRGKTYVTTGDIAALEVAPYDPVTKEVDLDVQGCLACLHPPQLKDAKGQTIARFVTTKTPRAIKAGRAIGLDVGSLQLAMSTAEKEARWKKQEKKVAPRLRVQFVYKLGPLWESGTFTGVTFVPLAYRVLDVCSGEVYATVPEPPKDESGKNDKKVPAPVALASGDPLHCPAPGEDLTAEERAAKEELAHLPLRLSREAIEKGMADVQEHVHDCHVEFEESGTVNVRLIVDGPTGKVKEAHVYPPFEKTPGGLCVRAAVKDAQFAHSKMETQEFKLPVYLR